MASFRYLGEEKLIAPDVKGNKVLRGVKKWGEVLKIRLHFGDGTKFELSAPNGSHFVAGKDVIQVEDERAVRHLRVDPRFEEVKE